MTDFQAELERFAALLPPSGTPILARFKSGPEAYAVLQNATARPMAPQQPSWAPSYDITAVPIDLIGEPWPSNLLVAIDQEGNAMKAWILND